MKTLFVDGHSVLLDDDLFDEIASMSLSVHENKNMLYLRSGRTYIHRKVAKAVRGQIVDHKNGNGLDNQRDNLRIAIHQSNKANQHFGRSRKTSKYLGVSVSPRGHIRASVKLDGRCVHLGSYSSEAEAAFRYDMKAKERFGESATLNFDLRL